MEKLYVLAYGGLNLTELQQLLSCVGSAAVHRVDLPMPPAMLKKQLENQPLCLPSPVDDSPVFIGG